MPKFTEKFFSLRRIRKWIQYFKKPDPHLQQIISEPQHWMKKSEERLKAVLPDRAKMGVVRDVGLPGNDRHPLQPGQRDRQSDPNVSAHPQETLPGTATSTSLSNMYNYSTGH
jgi:hypothetical protein